MRRRRVAWVVGLVALGVAAGFVGKYIEDLDDADGRFPRRIRTTDVVLDLTTSLPPDAVAAQDPAATVQLGELQPGGFRGRRRTIVAPAGAVVRLPLHVPDGGQLRLGMGVQAPADAAPAAGSGTRFVVRVDGDERLAREIDPAREPGDRQWHDVVIPLDDAAGRDVTLELRTERTGTAAPIGTQGWSRLQLVREHEHDRRPSAPTAPNVLLLVVDTLRADALGCHGASPTPSPVLDALAAQGTRFRRAVAQAPWTLPSVSSILTGLHPREHGVVGRSIEAGVPAGASREGELAFLSDRLPTIASTAARAGITTFGVSSNALVSRENNLARGFERFIVLRSNWERTQWAPAEAVNESFLRWAGRNSDRRFFAYLHYMEPHDPYVPADGWNPVPPPGIDPELRDGIVRRVARQLRGGRAPLTGAEIAYLRGRYAGAVRRWDQEFARLRAGLADLGLDDRTIIIVTADHGEQFQEHGQLGHRRQLYAESLHVPLILAGPGVPVAEREDQAQGIDLFPTVAGLLGLELPPGLAGRDLLRAAVPATASAVSETQQGETRSGEPLELLAVTQPAVKLIWTPALERYELYDLDRDPGERTNRWSDDARGAPLARLLDDHRRATPPPPPVAEIDPTVGEKLRALGYVP